ncbi:MAG TPA: sulfotransferase [Nevskiaceae bacterium]|nr:sulfotransferase [Nevskiaceae bacterium]
MKFESVLIVTYGRSGSTLLQGLLNSIDGVFVKGENENFLYGLFQAYESIAKAHRTFSGYGATEVTGAWFGLNSITPELFIKEMREAVHKVMFSDAPAGTRCRGFKEIRYFHSMPPEHLHRYLDFLGKLFPNPAFLINLRNHDDVVQSGWWRKHSNIPGLRRQLAAFEQSIGEWAKANPQRAYTVRYEDVISKGPTLMGTYDFLGASFDAARYEAVLATPHSYDQRQKSETAETQ